MWDVFKSRETKLFEKGMASGLNYYEAKNRASQALRCDLSHAGQDAFIYSGNSVDAHRRESGASQGDFGGVSKEYYLRTGDFIGARRLQSGMAP